MEKSFDLFSSNGKSFMSYWHITKNATYVCSPAIPGLMKYNWMKNRFMPLAKFPRNCQQRDAYALCTSYANKIICFPSYTSNIILFYDLKTFDFRQLPIRLQLGKDGARIFGIYWYLGSIFAVLYGTNQILEIDPISERIVGKFEMQNPKDLEVAFSTVLLDKIYLTTNVASKVIVFSMKNKTFDSINVSRQQLNFRAISTVGESLVMGGYKKEIYILNPMSHEVKIIPLPYWVHDSGKDDYYGHEFFCTDIFFIDGRLGFLSLHEPGVFLFDSSYETLDLIRLPEESATNRNTKSYTRLYIKDNRFLMLYSLVDERMVEVDIKKKSFRIVCPEVDQQIWLWMKATIMSDIGMNPIIFYHSLFSNSDDNPSKTFEDSIGDKIWSLIKTG